MTDAVVLDGVDQGYRKRLVFSGFSCRIPLGPTTALLGPNGAGKTTLMRTIATVLPPQAGRVEVLGHDAADRRAREQIRRQVSYLPQNFTADDALTVSEYVEYCLWLRGHTGRDARAATPHAIDLVDLGDHRNRRLRALSGGLRQRAGIAATIAGNPPLILLDEPTAGLDPEQRAQLRAVLAEMTSSTLVISTHLLEDAIELAGHLVIIGEGHIAYTGDPTVLHAGTDRSISATESVYRTLLRGTDAPTG